VSAIAMATDVYEVIVVGAGTTGAAAVYHLADAGVKNILCLEMGTPGKGRSTAGHVPGGAPLIAGEESTFEPENSGSAVFEGGPYGPSAIKMIVTLPPYLMLDGFAEHHGWDGVKAYLDLAKRGLRIELQLASKVLPRPKEQVKQLGSLMVCEADKVERLRREFDYLRRLGCDCEWWDKDRVVDAHGEAASFVAGIWFPGDARIDSASYARALLDAASKMGAVKLKENCAPMKSVTTIHVGHAGHAKGAEDYAEIRLEDGQVLRAKRAIVATGAMYIDEHLAGLLTPRYSYLTALPHREAGPVGGMAAPDSPNFFTFGFSHDWCVEDDFVRISGEDHFSGLKSPKATERCGNLAKWGWHKYPYLEFGATYPQKYGLYSETADLMPLAGMPTASSRVCYMVGCNAWGQASLSFVASLAPALLGYRELLPPEEPGAKLCSIRRFTGKAVVASARVSHSTQSKL